MAASLKLDTQSRIHATEHATYGFTTLRRLWNVEDKGGVWT